jgi:hypothetical protein
MYEYRLPCAQDAMYNRISRQIMIGLFKARGYKKQNSSSEQILKGGLELIKLINFNRGVRRNSVQRNISPLNS